MLVIRPENEKHEFSFNELGDHDSIFLAGPCPRTDYTDDWRFEAEEILKKLGFTGKVFNPTNPNYNDADPNHLKTQTRWEVEAMENAGCIVFWIPRSEEHPAFTTNIELGQWMHSDKSVIGWPEWAIRNSYIDARLELIGKERFSDLEPLLKAAIQVVEMKSRYYHKRPSPKEELDYIKSKINAGKMLNDTFSDGDLYDAKRKINVDKAIEYIEKNISDVLDVYTYRDGGSMVFRFKDHEELAFYVEFVESTGEILHHAYAVADEEILKEM